jgi:TolA-binding protein
MKRMRIAHALLLSFITLTFVTCTSDTDDTDRRPRSYPGGAGGFQRAGGGGASDGLDMMPPGDWWHDPQISVAVTLTSDQIASLDRISHEQSDEIAKLERDIMVAARELRETVESSQPSAVDITGAGQRLRGIRDALFDRRVRLQRQLGTDGQRRTGIYMGAYGYLENVKASSGRRIQVPEDILPQPLRENGNNLYLDPQNGGKYYYNLGAMLVNSGQAEAAGEAFKHAIELTPTYADAYYQYGVTLVGQAKIDTATGKVTPVPGTVEAFQKYLELQPNGQYAQSSKDMLTSLGGTLETKFTDPSAPKKKKGK